MQSNFINTGVRNAFLPTYLNNDDVLNIVEVSGGKDSTATAILANKYLKNNVFMFADTGWEHHETYMYLDYLEKELGVKIQRVKTDYKQRMQNKANKIRAGKSKRFSTEFLSNETIEKYIEMLENPTGFPMIDGMIWHFSPPSRIGKWCTSELKVHPMREVIGELASKQASIYKLQGIRKDESKKRSTYTYTEETLEPWVMVRPILDWTPEDVFKLHKQESVAPNPLYKKGMNRVGCMPCIYANKEEVKNIALYYPEYVEKVTEIETKLGEIAKLIRRDTEGTRYSFNRAESFLFFLDHSFKDRVAWALGENLTFFEGEFLPACSSQYGLCE
jgi:3'-phosphoadenosine 5'-phosphosulfate sulfotransferase (PAPS reductase)/FAD synthetase